MLNSGQLIDYPNKFYYHKNTGAKPILLEFCGHIYCFILFIVFAELYNILPLSIKILKD